MFFLTTESCPEGRADLKAREGASRGYSPALLNVQGWGCHSFVSSFLAAARAGRARTNGPERGRARTEPGQNGQHAVGQHGATTLRHGRPLTNKRLIRHQREVDSCLCIYIYIYTAATCLCVLLVKRELLVNMKCQI